MMKVSRYTSSLDLDNYLHLSHSVDNIANISVLRVQKQ